VPSDGRHFFLIGILCYLRELLAGEASEELLAGVLMRDGAESEVPILLPEEGEGVLILAGEDCRAGADRLTSGEVVAGLVAILLSGALLPVTEPEVL